MTKTPDEIKKGMECCAASYADCNSECPYKRNCDGSQILKDALALIQQKERENEKLTDDLIAERQINKEQLERIRQLEAERDAALADFKLYRERNIKGECGVYACDLCKRGGRYEDWNEIKCPTGCTGVSHWEWRGVQKE